MTIAATPLLSVVVPFYNVEAYIGECLESIRTQLLEDIEVVMVDDGSLDGSRAVAERYVAMDPRFRLITQENQGLGPARNTGTANSGGKYITFVDSDDLIAPRAYTLMVGSLEETGSDIAAGNAYRFSSIKGVYQSWTHREPFKHTLKRTTINRTPVLMRDRMIWNKVYRRSFWDAGAYEFPAIRYEDYMVTLRAYLEAPAVDIFANHVYFWRDRESGDSITQQAARADNARERYLSASMVLDVLADHSASQEVRERVHAYFIHIDLVALAESMVSVPEEDRKDLEDMALNLARRLDPGAEFETTRLAHLVHKSLLANDLPMVRNLARWRLSGDTKTFGKQLLSHPRPQMIPSALGAVLVRRKPQSPLKARRLKSKLTSATWHGQTLEIELDTTLRAQLAAKATVSAAFVWGERRTPVQATSKPHGKGATIRVTIDGNKLDGLGEDWMMAMLEVELKLGSLAWRGYAKFEPHQLPGICQMNDGRWLQMGGIGWYIGLTRLTNPVVIDHIEFDGDRFRISPAFGDLTKPVLVRRPAPSPQLTFSLKDGAAEIMASELVEGDPADNLVNEIAERPLVQEGEPLPAPLWTLAEDSDAGPDYVLNPHSGDRNVYLSGPAASTIIGDRRVSVGRGWQGMLVVRHEPIEKKTFAGAKQEETPPSE